RARRQREGDLEEPLLAVGELARRAVLDRREPELGEEAVRLLDRRAERRQGAPPVVRVALALEHSDRHRLERRQAGEERVDLEGAREARAHARLGPERADLA